MTADEFKLTMTEYDWMVVGKLQQMQVTDLLGKELTRAFAKVTPISQWREYHKIVRRLGKRGLTFEMLNKL